jgi:hypothetical protein
MNVSFPVQQTLAKCSILCLYRRIFGINKSFRKWINIISLIQFLYFLTTFVGSILICLPIQKYWTSGMRQGHCISLAYFNTGVETINSSLDFAMVALALLMLRGVQIEVATKFKLGLVFALAGA